MGGQPLVVLVDLLIKFNVLLKMLKDVGLMRNQAAAWFEMA